jgi:hypothetical protein
MKKIIFAFLILTMAVFLINPLPSEARSGHGGGRGGYSGGHGGGHWGWLAPWAVIGGAALLAPYYYAPPPVIIREETPVYIQPVPPVTSSPTEKIFVYPRQGQSEEQQAKDRYECHSWAVGQTGYDPTKLSAGDMPEARRNQTRADYNRAQDACLDGRGYTMR